MVDPEEPSRSEAVRLIFEYEGDAVRLVSQQRVDLAVTGFDIQQRTPPGHYVETRTETDETLSRVPIREAFAASREVFPEQPGEPITRIGIDRPSGAFTVVVPGRETADHVAVVEVTPRRRGAPTIGPGATSPVPGEPEVREIAAFQLED